MAVEVQFYSQMPIYQNVCSSNNIKFVLRAIILR